MGGRKLQGRLPLSAAQRPASGRAAAREPIAQSWYYRVLTTKLESSFWLDSRPETYLFRYRRDGIMNEWFRSLRLSVWRLSATPYQPPKYVIVRASTKFLRDDLFFCLRLGASCFQNSIFSWFGVLVAERRKDAKLLAFLPSPEFLRYRGKRSYCSTYVIFLRFDLQIKHKWLCSRYFLTNETLVLPINCPCPILVFEFGWQIPCTDFQTTVSNSRKALLYGSSAES